MSKFRNGQFCSLSTEPTSCKCDQECAEYGDCCHDAEFFKSEQQVWGANPFSCKLIDSYPLYLIASCPEETVEKKDSQNTKNNIAHPLLDVPVTSSRTNKTYLNGHCAICNNDFDIDDDILWDIVFYCGEKKAIYLELRTEFNRVHSRTIQEMDAAQKREFVQLSTECVEYNDNSTMWELNFECLYISFETIHGVHNHTFEHGNTSNIVCDVEVQSPEEVEGKRRHCHLDLVGDCPKHWKDADIRETCQAYQDAIIRNHIIYRNPFCYYCWFKSEEKEGIEVRIGEYELETITTKPKGSQSLATGAHESLAILVKLKGTRISNCKSEDIFDKTRRRCYSKNMLQKNKHIKGSRMKRFLVYSFLAWILPAFIVAVPLALHLVGVKTDFQPGFEGDCWFNNDNALLSRQLRYSSITVWMANVSHSPGGAGTTQGFPAKTGKESPEHTSEQQNIQRGSAEKNGHEIRNTPGSTVEVEMGWPHYKTRLEQMELYKNNVGPRVGKRSIGRPRCLDGFKRYIGRERTRTGNGQFCSLSTEPTSCKCDQECAEYGDCCHDSEFFKSEQQVWGASPFSCKKINSYPWYVVDSCPEETVEKEECQNPRNNFPNPLLDVPVTSSRTNKTYQNGHCAICNNDFDIDDDILWDILFYCGEKKVISSELRKEFNRLHSRAVQEMDAAPEREFVQLSMECVEYNENYTLWELNFQCLYVLFETIHGVHNHTLEHGTTSNIVCNVEVQSPEEVEGKKRYCHPDLIGDCPNHWNDVDIREKCQAYQDVIIRSYVIFRNPFCYYCWSKEEEEEEDEREKNVEEDNKEAEEEDLHNYDTITEHSVTTPLRESTHHISINLPEDYDDTKDYPVTILRKPIKQKHEVSYRSEESFAVLLKPKGIGNSKCKTEERFDKIRRKCYSIPKNSPNKDFTTPSYVEEFNDTSNKSEDITSSQIISENNNILSYMTNIGVSVSITCILLHLALFIATPRLRNLPAMNVASLSISLLLLYVCYITRQIIGIPCVVHAVIMHYCLLSTFAWTLATAFDVWTAIRKSVIKLQFHPGDRKKRFLVYSFLAWILPAFIVAVALVLHLVEVQSDYQPGFEDDCWFNNDNALLVFVVAPLSVVMLFNIVFFSWTAWLIYSSRLENRSSIYTEFMLFVRLSLIMGLTWIVGLLGNFIDHVALWYLFVLLNSLQGFFIFMAFSCTKRFRKELSNRSKFQSTKQTTTTTTR
ncbi:hypothetical protein C0J52_04822 [Blattella germanica]|nr:hypothetical protein C0J52_04822 [Blattella germanica]